MTGDQDSEAAACQEVSSDRDAFVAGRDLYEHPVEVSASRARGVLAGENGMQVNIFAASEPAEAAASASGAAGWLLPEVADPFMLEVHRPVQPDKPAPDLPDLPTYMSRDLDRELAAVVQAAGEGTSGVAVLVGGSSTGKTRACWEALRLLRDRQEPWRLWHPIDPSRPDAARRELPQIGPRTVIWLNEAQLYLDVADGGLGEKVAAGLRELLRDPARAPVLVLATLWPEFWERLTVRPTGTAADPHAQARELLAGRDITVPGSLTVAQVRQFRMAQDPRLVQAAAAAEDGQVVQYLAGTPELMARYRNASPAAAALMNAAIDARRLGMGIALPLDFLKEAAVAYLSDVHWDGLGKDWAEHALGYTSAPCKGVRGPLARIRLSSDQSYRLADYLEQYGRAARRACIPPRGFWEAAAKHARPSDLPALAKAATNRGLLRDAARLRKRAVAYGDASQAALLVRDWNWLAPHSNDSTLAKWAVAHARLDDPGPIGRLLNALAKAGAHDQIAALIARDPAAHADLENLQEVVNLLNALAKAGIQDQVAALAERAVVHADLDNPGGIAGLLNFLAKAGARNQVATLIARDPAAHADLEHVPGVARLLNALAKAGAHDQVAALIARDPATHADLDNPGRITVLLDALGKVDAHDQVAALAERAVAHADPGNPGGIIGLLDALGKVGAHDQVAALIARDPAAHIRLDEPGGIAGLLRALAEAGARDQVAALIARDPVAHADLGNPGGIIGLLDALGKVGAHDQVAALAERAVAHVRLDNQSGIAGLLDALGKAGAHYQVKTLVDRLPGEGRFSLYLAQADHQVQYRLGREADGYPSQAWGWKDLT